MSELTVANYLGALQQAPYSEDALEGLLQLLTSPTDGEPSPPLPLLEFARHGHEVRGEMFAAARLIEIEVVLVDDDPNFEAALWKELGRIRREELLDDAIALLSFG